MITFDNQLRSSIRANLKAHQRLVQPLEGRRHAAVAIVLVDSDPVRHDRDPVVAVDMSMVPGDPRDLHGRPFDGRMVGVAGGAAFLLCRRAAKLRRHAGQWALPGGRLDAGETPLQAALREVREELGLSLEAENVLGWLDDYPTRSGFVITPVVLWGPAEPELVPAPDEVLAVYRIGLQVLLDSEPRFLTIPESDRPILQLPLGNDVIHAPTGAVLYQLRQVALRGLLDERVHLIGEPVFAWR
ncbi:MAG TPA: CoA pyrophosphatase [Solirubrobacteraceae bacterium]|nr:CoA pyrophosphatase [Solirubrobacteraceae bacterium]